MKKTAAWMLLKDRHGIELSDAQWEQVAPYINAAAHHVWRAMSEDGNFHSSRFVCHSQKVIGMLIDWGVHPSLKMFQNMPIPKFREYMQVAKAIGFQEFSDRVRFPDVWPAGDHDREALVGSAHPLDSEFEDDLRAA